jgi:hypothetical protein
MSIYKKILAVQKGVEKVKKDGYNSFNKYAYVTEAAMLEAIKGLMNEQGLIALPSLMDYIVRDRGDSVQVFQTIKYTVIDTETGESVESVVLGAGEDKGDKGAYKGATGGSKYFLMKFFGVPTGDDPERGEPQQKQQGGRQAQPKKPHAVPVTTSTSNGQHSTTNGQTSKNQALVVANKIITLQKKYQLSNEEVLHYGEIESVKELAEAGKVDDLNTAYTKIANQVRSQKGA